LTKHTTRDEIVAYLDSYLRVAEIPDASPNGLQVQGRERVASIAYAVDASVQTIEAAAKARADMLVVHHGLWWGRHEQIVGNLVSNVEKYGASGKQLTLASCHQGDTVEIIESRPLSTRKRWRVSRVVRQASGATAAE